jgi:acetyl-CoA carboxylase biotin carboxyl carrier protein
MKPKIDYKEIIKLIDLLEERKLSHFELEVEGLKISIGRNPVSAPASEISSVPQPETSNDSPEVENSHIEVQDNLHYVTSPMVGTFYRSSDPASSSFVETGETIKKNQTLCIIEAMKLMNEIESDMDGVLEEIYVKNGKPVEYGQKLFAIRPK